MGDVWGQASGQIRPGECWAGHPPTASMAWDAIWKGNNKHPGHYVDDNHTPDFRTMLPAYFFRNILIIIETSATDSLRGKYKNRI